MLAEKTSPSKESQIAKLLEAFTKNLLTKYALPEKVDILETNFAAFKKKNIESVENDKKKAPILKSTGDSISLNSSKIEVKAQE